MPTITTQTLTAPILATFRDWRLQSVKPATVVRDIGVIQAAVNWARQEQEIDCHFPNVKLPKVGRQPFHVVTEQELERILAHTNNEQLKRAAWIAYETAMRRSEILGFKLTNLDADRQTLYLPDTKTGDGRHVPLSTKAVRLLSEGEFTITPFALSTSWRRARKRAGCVKQIRFHDLRHTAITRAAQRGFSTLELQMVSGHKKMDMLKRYTHISASDVARRLG